MEDEKDRWGQKLHDKKKADEDRYFAERDKAAIEKIRGKLTPEEVDEIREFARDRCPRCGTRLGTVDHLGVTVEECPKGHGTWIAADGLRVIGQREADSWLGRLLVRPRR
jgi:hypothetical protein